MLELLRSEWCGRWDVLVVPARDWGRRNARPSGGRWAEVFWGCGCNAAVPTWAFLSGRA